MTESYKCTECDKPITFNRSVRMKASAVVGVDERKRAKGRPLVRGDLWFCYGCHDVLTASRTMQLRYPELYGGPK
jgi:hypothetical protein